MHISISPPHCQHWRLSAGGQTLEQTLPIREVTPPGWQEYYCAWAHGEEPYGFQGDEQGSTLWWFLSNGTTFPLLLLGKDTR